MASPRNSPSSIPCPPIPDDPNPDSGALQLPISASIILTNLPHDAHLALEQAVNDTAGVPAKVTIRFQPVGSAPALRQKVFKVSSANRFETVLAFLTKKLAPLTDMNVDPSAPGVQVFCYVNSIFAPSLDEGVGELWKCFKTDDQLIVAYSTTPAFG